MRFPFENRQRYPPLREDSKVVTGEGTTSTLHILCRNDPPSKSSPGCPWVLFRPEKWTRIATIVDASLIDLPTTRR